MNVEPEFESQNTVTEPVAVAEPSTAPEIDVSPDAPRSGTPVSDRKVRGGMFGVPEIIAAAFSGLVLLAVLGFYFLVVSPAQSDLRARKAQRDEQDKKLVELKQKFGDSTTTEQQVARLEQSVSDFEFHYLPISSIGKTGLYDRLNGLMYAYHLRPTAGPDYVPLEIEVQKGQQPAQERGKNKFQSLFPGVYINMTVEGTYGNLRRFIGEIEASPQFVVISTVELQSTESKDENALKTAQAANPQNGFSANTMMPGQPGGGPPQPVKPAGPKGKTLGELVSLHIELAAYFRREAAPGTVLTAPAAQTVR
jgi:hypothetical protein